MWKKFLKHKEVNVTTIVSLVFVASGFIWAEVALRAIQNGPLILHFDDIQGITAIGGLGRFDFIGVMGLAIVILNYLIALELDRRDAFLGKLASVVTLIFALLLFIGFAAIISVN